MLFCHLTCVRIFAVKAGCAGLDDVEEEVFNGMSVSSSSTGRVILGLASCVGFR